MGYSAADAIILEAGRFRKPVPCVQAQYTLIGLLTLRCDQPDVCLMKYSSFRTFLEAFSSKLVSTRGDEVLWQSTFTECTGCFVGMF